MKRSSEAFWFFLIVYVLFTLGFAPFLSDWAWIIVFLATYTAWMVVPVMIEKQEEKEIKPLEEVPA